MTAAIAIHKRPTATARLVGAADWPSIAPAWERLAAHANPQAFLTPLFAEASIRVLDSPAALSGFLIERDGEPIGLIPGRFDLAGRAFTLWTHAYAPLGDPLVTGGFADDCASALLAELASRGVVALRAPMLDAKGAFGTALAATGRVSWLIDSHVRAALDLASPPPARSKETRRLARRLGETGRLEEASTAHGLPADTAIDAFLTLEKSGWKGRAGTAIANCPRRAQGVRTLVLAMISHGQARIEALTLDDRIIAAGIVLIHGKRAWFWKIAHDEGLARFSPGVILTHALGEALARDRVATLCDSCALPGHPMIDRIWPARLTIEDRMVQTAPGPERLGFRLATGTVLAMRAARASAKELYRRIRPARATAGG